MRNGILVALAAFVAFAPEAERALADERGVEEIVVHARRRDELLSDTPVSVTALDNQTLQATQTGNLEDVAALVPNLTILSGRSGQDASIVIRGIGAFPFIFYDQGVGTYVDGVFLARQQGTLLDIVDIQQIEVLRGPQGTLFGKNTIGGALNITTVKPQKETSGYINVRGGFFDQDDPRPIVETRGMLNIPIDYGWFEDRLFTRFAVGTKNDGGYTLNTFLDEWYSDQNAINFYGSVLLLPTEDIEVKISGQWSRDHNKGMGGECRVVQTSGFPFAGFMPPGFFDACRRSRPFRFESELPAVSDNTSTGVWGTLNWDLGARLGLDRLDLTYTGAWREQETRTRDDAEMTGLPVFSIRAIGGNGLNGGPNDARQIQQELQFHASADNLNPFGEDLGFAGLLDSWNLDFVGGVFGYWEDANTNTDILFLNGNPIIDNPPYPNPPNPGCPDTPPSPDDPRPPGQACFAGGGTTNNFVDTSNWDWAIFGQGVLNFTDWLSLTAGVRYTQEKKGLSRLVRNALMPYQASVDFSDSAKFDAWTPMATLAARATPDFLEENMSAFDNVMAYFTYSRGFRGGGFNGTARTNIEGESFTPEFADMYELGLKTGLWEHRLTVNTSVYWIDREDQQVPQLVNEDPTCDLSEPDCLPPPTRVFTRNAATARSRGFEVEFTAVPLTSLFVNGSVGFSESKFLDFPGAENAVTGQVINRAGQRQAFTPEWQTTFGAYYVYDLPEFGPDWAYGTLTPRIDWFWESQVENFAPEIRELVQPGYHRVNLRIGYRFNEARSEIAFWSRNLTDSTYFKNSLSWPRLTGTVIRYYEPPRTFGLEISHSF